MDIRPATLEDHAGVPDVHRVAFGDHGRRVAGRVDALRSVHGERAVGLVAVDGDQVLGHVRFTPRLLDAPRRLVEVAVLSPLGSRRHGSGKGPAAGWSNSD
jgi:putative acetyltransferase